jgi:hypothetical protein
MESPDGDRRLELLVVSVVLLFSTTLAVGIWFASKYVASNGKRSCRSEMGFRDQNILISLVLILDGVRGQLLMKLTATIIWALCINTAWYLDIQTSNDESDQVAAVQWGLGRHSSTVDKTDRSNFLKVFS